MAISLWPGLGMTAVLDEEGGTVPAAGISISSLTPYYEALVVRGHLVTYDPLDADSSPATVTTQPTLFASTTTALALTEGGTDTQIALVSGHTTAGDGGGGLFVWYAGDSTTADAATILGTGSGRWKRVYTGAVNVKWFGATGLGAVDDTTAVQAAITTGLDVEFPPGTYLCAGLTQSTNDQRLSCTGGVASLTKNANGKILTSTGDRVQLRNILFRGDASTPVYTGNNADFSGDYVTLDNCGSRWAYARAVLMTGSSAAINGTCDIYQTADATSAGYDIELGVSGTATLYQKITNINSSQSTGGIKTIDTGSVVISGCQFGKLTIASGTSPAGVNGGMTSGCRILGDVTVSLSNATLVGNQFGTVAIDFESGSSGCYCVGNAYASGATLVNNGNANNLILREDSAGSVNQLKFGGDSSLAVIEISPTTGQVYQLHKTDTGVTASTTQTQAAGVALALTGSFIDVDTCANTNDVIALPTAINGREVTVYNAGAQTLQVFPFTSDNLGAGVDTAITLTSGSTARWVAVSATNWRRLI